VATCTYELVGTGTFLHSNTGVDHRCNGCVPSQGYGFPSLVRTHFRRKGTVFHRWCGRTYLVSMLIVNISALSIYDLWGRFGPFHIAAIISLVSVLIGGFAAWRRSPAHEWKITHAYWMSWSYVGLLAAAVSESSTRYLNFDFGWSVGIATTAVVLVGATVINRRLPAMLGLRTRKSLP